MEAHFETKSDRLNLVSTILAFLDSCLTRHVQIDTLSLHGESFKLHYPETSLSEGVYAALRQLRRLNVYQRFLGQKGIVSLMLEKSRASGELALPLLEELHVLEYHPSSPEDIAAFICSHSFTRGYARRVHFEGEFAGASSSVTVGQRKIAFHRSSQTSRSGRTWWIASATD